MSYGLDTNFDQGQITKIKKLPNGYVWTVGCVQETQLNAHTKHCLVKRGKQIKVSSGQWQWAGCIMADACMKFH